MVLNKIIILKMNAFILTIFLFNMTSITIEPAEKNSLKLSADSLDVGENSDVELFCTLTINEGAWNIEISLIQGKMDNSLIEVLARGTGELVSQNTYVLSHLKKFTREDNEFIYYCETNNNSVYSNSIHINITYKPMIIELESFPRNRINEGEEKIFSCQVDGSNPPSEIEWLQFDRNGMSMPMNLEENIKISPTVQVVGKYQASKASRNLTVISTRLLNGRRFECSVSYQKESNILTKQSLLEVAFPPKSFELTSDKIEGVKEGENLILTCQSSVSHPPAKISWYEINGSHQIDMTDLAIVKSVPGDYGGIEVFSMLNVTRTFKERNENTYRCSIFHPSSREELFKDYKLKILYPPVVKLSSETLNSHMNSSKKLICETSGGNPGNGFFYEWKFIHTRNKNLTIDFESLEENLSNKKKDLIINPVKKENMGIYGCRVSSDGGNSTGLYYHSVKYLPELKSNSIQEVDSQLGESKKFHLYIDAMPESTSIEWFKFSSVQDSRIEKIPDNRFIKKKISDLEYSLTIKKVEYSDYGMYLARINHELGPTDFKMQLKPNLQMLMIQENSIYIEGKDDEAEINYKPPLNGYYDKIVLRACLRKFPRHSKDDSEFNYNYLKDHSIDLKSSLCEDHKIFNPNDGKALVKLPKRIEEYSYQLIVYDLDNSVVHQTAKLYWNPTIAQGKVKPLGSLLTATLIICSLLFLVILIIILITVSVKFGNKKGLSNNRITNKSKSNINDPNYFNGNTGDTSYLHFSSNNPDSLLNSRSFIPISNNQTPVHLANVLNTSFAHCDTSSLRSFQNDICSMRSGGSGQGFCHHSSNLNDFMDRSISSLNPSSPLVKGVNQGIQRMSSNKFYGQSSIKQSHHSIASSQGTKMSILSNRVMAEVFAAASRAASEAVFAVTSNMDLDINDIYDEETDSYNPEFDRSLSKNLPPKSIKGLYSETNSSHYNGSLNRKLENKGSRTQMNNRRVYKADSFASPIPPIHSKASCYSLKNGSSASDLNQTGGSLSSIPSLSINTLGKKKKNKINIKEISMKAASQAVAQILQQQQLVTQEKFFASSLKQENDIKIDQNESRNFPSLENGSNEIRNEANTTLDNNLLMYSSLEKIHKITEKDSQIENLEVNAAQSVNSGEIKPILPMRSDSLKIQKE